MGPWSSYVPAKTYRSAEGSRHTLLNLGVAEAPAAGRARAPVVAAEKPCPSGPLVAARNALQHPSRRDSGDGVASISSRFGCDRRLPWGRRLLRLQRRLHRPCAILLLRRGAGVLFSATCPAAVSRSLPAVSSGVPDAVSSAIAFSGLHSAGNSGVPRTRCRRLLRLHRRLHQQPQLLRVQRSASMLLRWPRTKPLLRRLHAVRLARVRVGDPRPSNNDSARALRLVL